MTLVRTCSCGRPLPSARAQLCDLCRVPRARSKRHGRPRLARAERYLRQAIASPALIAGVEQTTR